MYQYHAEDKYIHAPCCTKCAQNSCFDDDHGEVSLELYCYRNDSDEKPYCLSCFQDTYDREPENDEILHSAAI